MTIRYSPDTCGCVIDLEHGSEKFVDWVKKCPGHKDLDGQKLIDAIKTQCLKFQLQGEHTKEAVVANLKLKRDEKANMKAVVVNDKLIRKTIL